MKNEIISLLFIAGLVLILLQNSREAALVYPEIEELAGKPRASFKELSNYFTELTERKGAEYAFNVLNQAPVPPGTDMHLLGHVVGDVLYRQKGIAGIEVCTQDFRNACSHSIVIGGSVEYGEAALPKIAEACRKAPGGSGAYTMCFHGLGHGVLAYTEYDLKKTAEICEKTATREYDGREAHECIGGAIMEMYGEGYHNPEKFQELRKEYLLADDPLSPCNRDFIPAEAKYMCYFYLTPHLFELGGANLARPTRDNFERAFPLCGKIPKTESQNREACYGGFGKEFVVLAQYRDIRRVDQMSDAQFKQVYEWCLLADNYEGIVACINHAVNSIYWGGENDRTAAIRFCSQVDSPSYKNSCFGNLIGAVDFYIQDVRYKKEFCEELPEEYRDECRIQLRL